MSWHLAGQLLLPLGQLPAGSCGKVGDGPYTWPCQLCWETGMQCPASRLSLAQSDLLWLSGELTSKWKTISSVFLSFPLSFCLPNKSFKKNATD